MKRKAFIAVYAVALTACLVLSTRTRAASNASGAAGEPAPKMAPQVFKNIQVLKDMPADRLLQSMQFICASLNVNCSYCHGNDGFEKDDKAAKQTARKMIQMQFAINEDFFNGENEVTCNSCHKGSPHPGPIPSLVTEHAKPTETAEESEATARSQPAVDALIAKYVQAVGGESAIAKISTRVEKGTLSESEKDVQLEIYMKAPNKRLEVAHRPDGEDLTAYDGRSGWMANSGQTATDMSSDAATFFSLDADPQFPIHLKQNFYEFHVEPTEKIGNRSVTPVVASGQNQPLVTLYFDQLSGLLVRMLCYSQTPIGPSPVQIDYADYRLQDGVKVPFRQTFTYAHGEESMRLSEVRQNVPIDDSKFEKPANEAKSSGDR